MDDVMERLRAVDWEQFRIDPMKHGPGHRQRLTEEFMEAFINAMKE